MGSPFPVIPLRSKDAGEEVKLRMHETWLGVVHVLLKIDLLNWVFVFWIVLMYKYVLCFIGDVAGRCQFRDPSFFNSCPGKIPDMAFPGNFWLGPFEVSSRGGLAGIHRYHRTGGRFYNYIIGIYEFVGLFLPSATSGYRRLEQMFYPQTIAGAGL